ncbi:MAG: exoribonuclease R [Clostridia bacterium]|nr:exoribonuclease R [Clostridia bacterium]
MTMLTEMQFTEARKDLSSLYNKVYSTFEPVIIKRKQTEEIIALRVDLQKQLLSNFTLKAEILSEEDGSITLALDQLEMYVNGQNVEIAVCELVKDLKEYVIDYLRRSQLFLNAPNRKSHFPYVLRVLLCDTDEEIRSLLEF